MNIRSLDLRANWYALYISVNYDKTADEALDLMGIKAEDFDNKTENVRNEIHNILYI